MDERLPISARLGLVVAYAAVVGLLGWGTFLCWDYFVYEHNRTQPWKALLCLTADLSAFAWFQGFFWRHAVRGRTFEAVPWDEFIRRRGPYGIVLGLVGAIGIDAMATYNLRSEDEERFEHRVEGKGTVERVVENDNPVNTKWELFGTLTAPDGEKYPFRFRVAGIQWKGGINMEKGTPPEIGPALAAKPPTFDIRVAYDPDWPSRNWLAGPPWDDANRSWYVGYIFLIVQGLGVVFALALLAEGKRKGEMRAAWECVWIMPLLFQALTVFGLGMSYASERVMNLS